MWKRQRCKQKYNEAHLHSYIVSRSKFLVFINIFVLFYDLHLHDILSHPLFLFTEIIKTRTFFGGRNFSKSIKIAVSVNYVASRFSLLIYCVVCVYQVCWLMTSCYTYVDIELHMFIYVNITFCYVQKLNILFSCLDYKLYITGCF